MDATYVGGGPLERNVYRAWTVTVVGIECDDAVFNVTSRRSTPQIVLSRNVSIFCKHCGKLDYSRYCQVLLLLSCFIFFFR